MPLPDADTSGYMFLFFNGPSDPPLPQARRTASPLWCNRIARPWRSWWKTPWYRNETSWRKGLKKRTSVRSSRFQFRFFFGILLILVVIINDIRQDNYPFSTLQRFNRIEILLSYQLVPIPHDFRHFAKSVNKFGHPQFIRIFNRTGKCNTKLLSQIVNIN